MSEVGYVKLWSAGVSRRLAIHDEGDSLLLVVEVYSASAGAWETYSDGLDIPVRGASDIGDVAAGLAKAWDVRTLRELAARAMR